MREEYVKELNDLKERMIKAEKFSEKLPLFKDQILKNKYTGEENWMQFDKWYKGMYLAWGLNRGFYKKEKDNMTNNKNDYCGYYFNIYINTLTLYDLHEKFDLYEMLSDVDIFFIDHLNTTFYVSDENIESFLDALNVWYLQAKSKVKKFMAEKKLQEAKEELAKAEKILNDQETKAQL